jgi:hypothetical protein
MHDIPESATDIDNKAVSFQTGGTSVKGNSHSLHLALGGLLG